MTQRIDPQACLREMYEIGPKLAIAKANRMYMEEYRKTLKAQLMKGSNAKSAVDREADAYAAEAYVSHLAALGEAVINEEKLRWAMVTNQAEVEVWRSMEASGRAMDRGTR